MKYSPEEVGKIIRSERTKRGWTQKKLAGKLGISDKQISNYEKGKPIPPQDMLMKIAEVFGCECGYLLGEAGYEDGTRLDTTICDSLGLSLNAINSLREVTHLGIPGEIEIRQQAISSFFESLDFKYFIDCLVDAYEASTELEKATSGSFAQLEQDFGDSVLAKALSLQISSSPLPDDETTDPKVAEAYIAIDECIDEGRDVEFEYKVAKYELRESFEQLVRSFLK